MSQHEQIARKLVAPGWPAAEPQILEILNWAVDTNCTAYRVVHDFLLSVGEPLIPHMKKALQNGDSDLAHAIVSNLLPMMPRSSVVPLEDDLLRIAATTELGWYDDLWAIDLLLEQGVGDRGALMSLLEKKLKDSDPGRGMDISDILAKYRAG